MCDNYACQSRIRALSELKDFSYDQVILRDVENFKLQTAVTYCLEF